MAYDRLHILEDSQGWAWSSRRRLNDKLNKRGLNTKVHMAVDAHGVPVIMLITESSINDYTQVFELTKAIDAQKFIADKAYENNDIVGSKNQVGAAPIIPLRKIEKYKEKSMKICIN